MLYAYGKDKLDGEENELRGIRDIVKANRSLR